MGPIVELLGIVKSAIEAKELAKACPEPRGSKTQQGRL